MTMSALLYSLLCMAGESASVCKRAPVLCNLFVKICERSCTSILAFDLISCEAIWRLLDEGELALDVGANIGYMTSLMAARLGKNGRVIAFEPHPVLFQEPEQMLAGDPSVLRTGDPISTQAARVEPLANGPGRDFANLRDLAGCKDFLHYRGLHSLEWCEASEVSSPLR